MATAAQARTIPATMPTRSKVFRRDVTLLHETSHPRDGNIKLLTSAVAQGRQSPPWLKLDFSTVGRK